MPTNPKPNHKGNPNPITLTLTLILTLTLTLTLTQTSALWCVSTQLTFGIADLLNSGPVPYRFFDLAIAVCKHKQEAKSIDDRESGDVP